MILVKNDKEHRNKTVNCVQFDHSNKLKTLVQYIVNARRNPTPLLFFFFACGWLFWVFTFCVNSETFGARG